MTKKKKPKVITKCVADHYSGDAEKIIEISHANGGCLICLTASEDKLFVHVYRQDKTVEVSYEGEKK